MIAYDHPLVQLTSRSSLLSHFQLLHLLSTLYVPSISPRALVQHIKFITSALRTIVLGNDTLIVGDIERRGSKGKEKAWDMDDLAEGKVVDRDRWWRVWDVRADCREIGGMECYGMSPVLAFPFWLSGLPSDGYHLALIQQYVLLHYLH